MRRTALHWACQGGHVRIVELLVDYGANTEVGNTLLLCMHHFVPQHLPVFACYCVCEERCCTSTWCSGALWRVFPSSFLLALTKWAPTAVKSFGSLVTCTIGALQKGSRGLIEDRGCLSCRSGARMTCCNSSSSCSSTSSSKNTSSTRCWRSCTQCAGLFRHMW